jgi:hypothetical protein
MPRSRPLALQGVGENVAKVMVMSSAQPATPAVLAAIRPTRRSRIRAWERATGRSLRRSIKRSSKRRSALRESLR